MSQSTFNSCIVSLFSALLPSVSAITYGRQQGDFTIWVDTEHLSQLRQPDHRSFIIRALCDNCDNRLPHIGPPSCSIFGFFLFFSVFFSFPRALFLHVHMYVGL